MNTILKSIVIPSLVALLCACAGSPPEPEKTVDQILADKNLEIAEEISQLVAFNVRGWQYVNRQNVILEDGPSKKYLVELNRTCHNLDYAHVIGFTSFGRVVSKSEKLIVRDGSGRADHCLIKTIYRLEKISG